MDFRKLGRVFQSEEALNLNKNNQFPSGLPEQRKNNCQYGVSSVVNSMESDIVLNMGGNYNKYI